MKMLLACLLLVLMPLVHAQDTQDASAAWEKLRLEGFALLHNPRVGNCSACHSVPDELGRKRGVQSNFAPPLDGVANRYTAQLLRQWVVDARVINPQTRMPPFGVDLGHGRLLTDAQINAVLADLESLR